jgi:hypothetical protein
VDQVLGVKNVTFDYRAEGKRRTLQIHNVAEAEIEAVSGQGGAEVMISNQPLCVTPGQPGVVAKSERLSYRDHGMNWEISGKHGLFSAFVYQGP